MLVTYPVAAVLLGVLAVTAGGPVRPGAMLWGSLYGVSQAVGVYWFYAAVSAGPISVVSPLAAVLNAAVPVAVGVALGERPGETASAGVVLAMFAVILVSRESPADEDVRTHRFTSKVAWLTVGSGVASGWTSCCYTRLRWSADCGRCSLPGRRQPCWCSPRRR
ncbi:MAG: hypothetical protein QOE94_614 [Mycobacterium sp.]|nr:hypothetical protein [Mycobacterium sp.]